MLSSGEMMEPAFLRARRPEHKQQRRETILAAARSLGERHRVRNVSLGDIAAEVGLAKSNVLRYFETREEVYLYLTAEGWREWVQAVHAGLDEGPATPAEVAECLARTLSERPLFCDLLGQAPANLEHNVSPEGVREFKLVALECVDDLARLIAAVLPGCGITAGREIVAGVALLGAGLWPIANPPAALAVLYKTDPALAAACVEFVPTLQRLVRVVTEGICGPGRPKTKGR